MTKRTELECYEEDCDGQLLEDDYEKYCDTCYVVVGSGDDTFERFCDTVADFWEERKEYRFGDVEGRPYVFGSWSNR